MNPNLAIRWTGRVRPRLFSGPQATTLRAGKRSPQQQQQQQSFSRVAHTPISQRQFSQSTARRSSRPKNIPPRGPPPQHAPKGPSKWKQWALFNAAGLTAAIITALALKNAPPNSDEAKAAVINKTSFTPFTITAKEQVSPTAFVLTIQPGEALRSRSAAPLEQARRHGLWSVEVKQPQLQIARHYTPLPATTDDGDDDGSEDAALRLLIRKLDGGELSTYLSKLRVGEQVWLRGPHLGFDVARRLGAAANVVFLAGGTGIAPALQVARRLLEPHDGQAPEKPRVSILWANRRAADALGRQPPQISSGGKSSWLSSRRSDAAAQSQTQDTTTQPDEPSLARQIRELQQKHPGHFQIAYYVDEENRYITPQDLSRAIQQAARKEASPLIPAAASCVWHAPAMLEKLPDDNDADREPLPCACAPAKETAPAEAKAEAKAGANLVLVSGPDGFVEAYAGPKRWYGGHEMQGPVRGVLGKLAKEMGLGNWLVLKL
ncbi:hypothetical protein F5Y05DRAFT_421576 [Hypoxylon sp. FL0543]|nr:hypothetical protein F5Y05DRAFT_421576 [Hypoxylon sp. FL0543]